MPLLQPKCSEGESWDSCTCGGDLLVDSKFFHPTDIRKLLKRKYISDKENAADLIVNELKLWLDT